MGWKAIKDYFKIEHLVCVTDGNISITDDNNICCLLIDKSGDLDYSSSVNNLKPKDYKVAIDTLEYFDQLILDIKSNNKDYIVSLINQIDVFFNPKTLLFKDINNDLILEEFEGSSKYFVNIEGLEFKIDNFLNKENYKAMLEEEINNLNIETTNQINYLEDRLAEEKEKYRLKLKKFDEIKLFLN